MKTKASTSKKIRNAGRRPAKRRSTGKSRRSRSAGSRKRQPMSGEAIIPSLVEEAPITARSALSGQQVSVPDKRDDELTDEESLDREERQELY